MNMVYMPECRAIGEPMEENRSVFDLKLRFKDTNKSATNHVTKDVVQDQLARKGLLCSCHVYGPTLSQ